MGRNSDKLYVVKRKSRGIGTRIAREAGLARPVPRKARLLA